MNYYPFDSRNSIYKSHIGAVAAGEKLQLRLLLHKDAHVHEAFLRVFSDINGALREITLTAGEWLEDYRFYEGTLSLDTGLYWYDFRYTSDFGEYFVVKKDSHLGIVQNCEADRFQLTVYDEKFSTPEWLKGGIIYQIFPDRFYNSGKEKQGVPDDRYICGDWDKIPEHRQNVGVCALGNDYYGGDLKGITQKLGYLKDLGVSCIYLNPIFEAHSNHRYNTADYMKIDPLLGSERDLKQLCAAAKRKGIAVILDGVFSHTGDDSIYFNRQGRYGKGGAYNDYNSPYHSWFKFNHFPEDYEAWWGVPSLPETVEDNPEFTEFITGENGVIRKYLRLGISGWRLDVADELPDRFLDNIRTAVKAEREDAYLLGEVWEDASNKISYNARRRFLLGRQLDSVMNYPFANAILRFIKHGGGEALAETIEGICENYPSPAIHTLMNHIGTHDTPRMLTTLIADDNYPADREWQSQQKLSSDDYELAVKRLKAAAVIQYTLPGVPSLYYGDEAGKEGFGDPFCRGTYPWGNENKDLLKFYKELGQTRRRCQAFKDGEFEVISKSADHIAYVRSQGKSLAFIAVNSGSEPVTVALPDMPRGNLNVFGKSPKNNELELLEYEYCIITVN